MSMKTKRICPVCQTNKFRKSADSGLVCKYGHKVLGVQQEQAEDDRMGHIGSRRKTIPKAVKFSLESSPAQQRSDFVLVVQDTLQVLSKCLVHDFNFPPELEATLRELWLLYLSDTKTQLAEAYLFEALEKDTVDTQKDAQKDILEKFEEVLVEEFRDDDDSEEDDIEFERIGSSRSKWPKLNFASTLVFIYLACIYLNYPILPNDLIRWCRSGDLPFLAMQDHIPPETLASFSLYYTNQMRHVPSPTSIKNRAFIFSRCYQSNCKLVFPDFNIPLYLDRFCGQYFLSPDEFFMAQYIFDSYRSRNFMGQSVQNRRHYQIPVTTFLMASVVATVKIVYAIGDNRPAFDKTLSKEAYLKLIKENVKRWKKLYKEQDELDNVIHYIQKTSVASRIGAPVRDKNVVVLNSMDKTMNGRATSHQTMDTPFMDPMILKTEEKKEEQTDETNEIGLGQVYYRQMSGAGTPDYLDVLELATLVTGEIIGDDMKNAIHKIDVDIIRHNPNNTINRDVYAKLLG
ncbi:hypothetical protein INT47_006332 [Mucor saturninus]|uniref:Rrn7/TAF1B N-terminal cyclin domain-containing protein n=1 Tax=Mucor saturninus TaxID=64648 RepID=A0A8H7RKB5_9FUNG|nr:hypothetical protein INT47_006332 [Mucor saturninus]